MLKTLNSKFNLHVGSVISYPVQYAGRAIRWTWRLQARERTRLSQEMREIKGLMPLVMKQRNGYRWSPADKSEIKVHLRHLVSLSPYLTLFVMPGGFVVLPFLAWWLDRRRQKRVDLRS
jgi:hypothetical protein